MFKNKKAIIFDLDNTLYDFSATWLKAHKELFYYLKLNEITDYNTFLNIFKKYDKELLENIKNGNLRVRRLRNERIIKTMNYFSINYTEEMAKNYYLKMFEFIEKNLVIDKKLVTALNILKNKYKLFLLTNGIAKEQLVKIKKLNLENIFEKVYISSETMINKPNLRAFLQIALESKIEIDEFIMIGDSLHHDIEPAIKLGMATCHIKKEWHLTNLNSNKIYNGYSTEKIIDFLKLL